MRLLRDTLPTCAENLACDEALLLDAESGTGGEVLRLWQWPALAVVLGAGGRVADDVHDERCRAESVPIGRRASGGGTVLLGPGCLLYSLVLSYERAHELTQIGSSYRYILGKVREALAPIVPGIELAGTSDLAIGGRKFSGNSQQRKQRFLLHHGSLLVNFDFGVVGKYLKPPPRQPEYRAKRDHQDFLVNLPCTALEIEGRLRAVWHAHEETSAWPMASVRRLVEEKYGRPEWVRRR